MTMYKIEIASKMDNPQLTKVYSGQIDGFCPDIT